MTDNRNPPEKDAQAVLEIVDVLHRESAAINATADRVNESIAEVISILMVCEGRIIVTGMGKMGCIARKAAATFCSTGSPAVFLHPSEAVHGDLGIVTENDILVALSNSGETRELLELLPFMARLGVPVIGLTGNTKSSLATRSRIVVDVGVETEADPISVAPTSSTTVTLAMCDALAIALMKRRGFTKEQFAIFHPGGNLGGKLLIQVADVMHSGDKVPMIGVEDSTLADAIQVISQQGLGAVFVIAMEPESERQVVGIVTDGDLRRVIETASKGPQWNVWKEPLSKHMTAAPKVIGENALAAEALRLMEGNGITVLPVVDTQKKLTGVIHLHDLIRAGLA